jgi:hypothetical protein
MAIRRWHYGKLILLWTWGIVLCVVLIRILATITDFVPGFTLIAALLAVLIALSVITWKWLSGKEAK